MQHADNEQLSKQIPGHFNATILTNNLMQKPLWISKSARENPNSTALATTTDYDHILHICPPRLAPYLHSELLYFNSHSPDFAGLDWAFDEGRRCASLPR